MLRSKGGQAVPGGSSAARLPVPGQELADAVDQVVGDAGEDVAQIGFGVETIHLGSLCRPSNYAERFSKRPVVCAHLRPVERTPPQFHSA